jgi:hypothetical protein
MKLVEAKRILKNAGYKLLKEYWDMDQDYDYDPPDGPDPSEYKCLITINKNLDDVKKDVDGNNVKDLYILGLTDEEKAQITKLDLDFIDVFSCWGPWTGEDYCYATALYDEYGEDASWDGHDFGSYDPGWGESEYAGIKENVAEINEKVKAIVKAMIEGFEDAYTGDITWNDKKAEEFYKNMTKEQYTENLKKILTILLNRNVKNDTIE